VPVSSQEEEKQNGNQNANWNTSKVSTEKQSRVAQHKVHNAWLLGREEKSLKESFSQKKRDENAPQKVAFWVFIFRRVYLDT
jgi:hypothetical protein